jgi:ribosome-binding protein aMBF1 (putative translation factor)
LVTLATERPSHAEAPCWADVRDGLLDGDATDAYERARLASHIGRQLAMLRTGRGLSPAQLARRSGTSEAIIEQVEGGSGRIDLDALASLSVALDAQVDLAPAARHTSMARCGINR